jgi:hypothetical protein
MRARRASGRISMQLRYQLLTATGKPNIKELKSCHDVLKYSIEVESCGGSETIIRRTRQI